MSRRTRIFVTLVAGALSVRAGAVLVAHAPTAAAQAPAATVTCEQSRNSTADFPPSPTVIDASCAVIRLLARTLLVCTLLASTACNQVDPPAPALASSAGRVAAGGAPAVCAASQKQCGGLSQCAAAPLTGAAATIPARTCTFEDGQGFVDIYSWNIFLALNWPAATETCAADTGKNIVNVKSGDGTFVVWQTWMPSENVFVNPGTQKPAAWCTGNGLAAGPQRLFSNESKATANAKRLGGKFTAIAEPGGDVLQASGDVVTDQAGRWLRYERIVNQTEYAYITADRWNAPQLEALKQKGEEIALPAGAIEIKSAWKVLTADEIAGNRYFTTQGVVCNTPDGQRTPCDQQPVTMGLVGLHIVQQVNPGGTLFWSTFEHVDNERVFYNRKFAGPDNTDFASSPYAELDPSCKPRNQPTQIRRVTPIPAAADLNAYYQQLLGGSVFANYQLISTQWTTGAGESQAGTPQNVANITLETYVQDISTSNGNGFSSTGCFACHLRSSTVIPGQSGGHSFLFLEAKYATMGKR